MNLDAVPTLELTTTAQGPVVMLRGLWTALALSQRKKTLLGLVRALPNGPLAWDLTCVERLDHVGAQALWRYWQRQYPERISLTPTQRALFDHLAEFDRTRQSPVPPGKMGKPHMQTNTACLQKGGCKTRWSLQNNGRFEL